jgi:hypothetical protein
MKLRSFVPSLLLICVLALLTAQACGPDFVPDVFVLKLRPDKPKDFAAGKLGVLLPTYPRADLIVAFRYLNGGVLSPAEQAAYAPTYAESDPQWMQQWTAENAAGQAKEDPVEVWMKLRAHYAGPGPAVQPQRNDRTPNPAGYVIQTSYDNCNVDAFRTAAATLNARAKAWGDKSPDLADWIKGQDTVFDNCPLPGLKLPADAPAGSSALLKADRAYQQAAARFYAAGYADARKNFEDIAQDADSPWRSIAPYLAARCLVRQAFADGKVTDWGEMASFDPTLMQQAADLLQSLLKQDAPGAPRQAIRNELDLVRMRTEPMVRARELAAALAGPRSDPGYDQHLKDLTWLLNVKLDQQAVRSDFGDPGGTTPDFGKAYTDLKDLRASTPLIDWLITFQSPADQAKDHAIAQWKSAHETAWLLVAISKATEKDAAAPDLAASAAEVKPDSPAWESFTYHRIRLLIALGRGDEARTLLAKTLPMVRAGGRDSSINLFLGLEARASANLTDFLTWAPRKVLDKSSQEQSSLDECTEVMKNPKRVYDCARSVDPVQFSADSANFINAQASLATLADAANSSALPQQLRTSVAIMAWVRAVLLEDDATAARLFPLLPERLQQQAGPGTGFHPLMTLLRNPGLRPYLDPGVQRNYSYDFVESYADNWWCKDWKAEWYPGNTPIALADPATFLAPAQRAQANQEVSKLIGQNGAAVYLGSLTLDYARAHPDDQDVPESLYLVLRMIRYSCDRWTDDPNTKSQDSVAEIRKEAARLLRQRYPTSPWTKRAAPYAG